MAAFLSVATLHWPCLVMNAALFHVATQSSDVLKSTWWLKKKIEKWKQFQIHLSPQMDQFASISDYFILWLDHVSRHENTCLTKSLKYEPYYTFVQRTFVTSLVENFNSYFLAPISHNFNMLYFDPNPVTIGYLVTESWRNCQC